VRSLHRILAQSPRAGRPARAALSYWMCALVGPGDRPAAAAARCLQHETDHLHGELYIDKLAGAERRRVMRELRQHQIAARR
jgi:Polypeptide deformylase